jgi:hypothetical protein
VTEPQRLFLVQARSDFIVFELLRDQPSLPPCHALHYLQMATELFGKAHAWKNGPNFLTHRALVGFLRSLTRNRRAQRQLGYEGKNEKWENLIRSSIPLAQRVEDLAPALTQDGPNPEYPWPRADPASAPAEFEFSLWQELEETEGRQFLRLLGKLFASAEAFL